MRTLTKEQQRADGDFYYSQSDYAQGQHRLELLMKARDAYLQGGATREARCVERAIDRSARMK